MPSDKTFKPEFGPNGAVLNGPTMTPEMRAKFDQIGKLPPRAVIWRNGQSIALAVAIFLALNDKPARQFLLGAPWWSGALAGALAAAAVFAMWSAARSNLQRWELHASQRNRRALVVPEWGRWLFAIADTVGVSAYFVAIAWFVADVGQRYWPALILAALFAISAVAIGLAFRWYATKRGWSWKI